MRALALAALLAVGATPTAEAEESITYAQAAALLLVGASVCQSEHGFFTDADLDRFIRNATRRMIKKEVPLREFEEAVDWAGEVVLANPPDPDDCAEIGTTLNEE